MFFLKMTRQICTNFFHGLEENTSLQPALKSNALVLLGLISPES